MSSATRSGFCDGNTMPSWPTRSRLVCIAMYKSSSTGIVRQLEAFDVKVMLGETDRVVAEVVGEARLPGDVVQHLIVEMSLQSDAPFFDVGFAADRR